MYEVVITPRARHQLRAALQWWLQHREKAPGAFDEDISRGLATIAAQPLLGARVPEKPGVRRLFMRRIGYFIYYRIAASGTIDILAVWHHSRGSGPPL
jgi:plasmid stabilization system protein ParE